VVAERFLWGAAVSSHQVEGDNRNNDWWDWERAPGHIADGSTSGAAAEWWSGRAEEDLARAKSLGLNAIRMSVEWSRLEPEPGRFDPSAFERYRAILRAARDHDLRVMMTLHHFTLPKWAAKLGGFSHDHLPELLEGFAERTARELGDHVSLWATINEPSVLAIMGYAGTRWPPGRGSMRACFEALARMLSAHERMYRAIHRVIPSARVGIVLNAPYFTPASDSMADRVVTRAQDWAFSGAVLHALRTGALRPPISIFPRTEPMLPRSYDWIGLNYYGRYDVRFDPKLPQVLFGRHVQSPTIKHGDTDWGQPDADGMLAQLRRLSDLHVPLYVTENGVYDNEDERRPRYLRDHVDAVLRARREGLDVRGYFHWALVDNFEWAEGWATRFGLFALDRETQERTRRKSAEVFTELCSATD
jgi:beta-glucosidase